MGMFLRSPAPITAAAAPVTTAHPTRSPYSVRRPIAGSARTVDISTATSAERPYAGWQQDAWTAYEKVGEVHYGVDSLAKLLSRVRVYAGVNVNADDAPMEVDDASEGDQRHITSDLAADAKEAVQQLILSGLGDMLRTYCLNISVPGECYLIRMPDPTPRKINPDDPEPPATFTWVIRSTDEVQVRQDHIEVTSMRGATGQERRNLSKDTYIARLWKPSPRFSGEPDSSMVGIADAVEELLLLSRVTRGTARSRLNAGLLFVPDSITVASVTPAGTAPSENPSGDFLADVMESILTPIGDEGSAAGVVPMLITGPGDEGEKIKHITFQRPGDESLRGDKERALERVLQGLDIPKEIVTGLANVKYSNALVIDDNMFKANVEPLALLFVDSMTTVFLRPVLRSLRGRDGRPKYTEQDLAKLTLWYDPSEIVTQPDAGADATEGYNLGLLSGDAWRRARGYSEGDGPDEAELAYMMVTRTSTQLPEETLQTLLQRVFPQILGQARKEALDAQPVDTPPSALKLLQPNASTTSTATADETPAATAASGARRRR